MLGDLSVNRLGFGALHITRLDALSRSPSRREVGILLRRAVELGVNLIDTADSYGPYLSEELIGEALSPCPPGLVIATKGGFVRRGAAWIENGRSDHLRQALEGSLRRLRVERIDLYQLHTVDSRVPIEESVGALVAMQAQGKIRHIGVSNVSVDELARARKVARIVSVQNRYSLTDRESDDVVDVCTREGLGFLPWYPLNTGALARSRDAKVREIAGRHRATPAQVALAWLLRRSPVILPIPGTSRVSHVEENIAAAALRLTDAEFKALAAL